MRYLNQLMIVLIFSMIIVGMVYSQSTTTPASGGGASTSNSGSTNENSITATKDPNDSSKYTDVKDNNGEIIGNGNFQGKLSENENGGFSVSNFNGEMTTKDGTKVSGSADQVIVGKDGSVVVKGLKSGNKDGGGSSSTSGSLITQDGTKISGSADTVTIDKDKKTTIEGLKNGEMTLKDGTSIKGYADKIEIDEKGVTTITGFMGDYKAKDGTIISTTINYNTGKVDNLKISGNKVEYYNNDNHHPSLRITTTSKSEYELYDKNINNMKGKSTTVNKDSIVEFSDEMGFQKINAVKGSYTDHNSENHITISANGKIEQVKTGSSNFVDSVDYYSKDKKLVQVRDGTIADPNRIVKDESNNEKKVEYWQKWSKGALIDNGREIRIRQEDGSYVKLD